MFSNLGFKNSPFALNLSRKTAVSNPTFGIDFDLVSLGLSLGAVNFQP